MCLSIRTMNVSGTTMLACLFINRSERAGFTVHIIAEVRPNEGQDEPGSSKRKKMAEKCH
jgi:hypothetical protein